MSIAQVYSPRKNTLLTLMLEEGALFYQVSSKDRSVVGWSPLGLETDNVDFTKGLSLEKETLWTVNDDFSIPAFKKSACHTQINALTWTLRKDNSFFLVEVWVSDDGAAIRMTLPGEGRTVVNRETTGYRMPENTMNLYGQKLLFSYEDHYHPIPLEDLHQNACAFPMLAQLGSSLWALYTEASVFGGAYGGSHLTSTSEDPTLLQIQRAPDQLTPLTGQLPFSTPWRVVLAGSLDSIISSNFLESLNPPSIVKDPSFIRPGRIAWSWLVENKSSKDPLRMQEYIDYAAEMGFEYSLIDGGWPGHVDIPEMVDYAAQKGVGIWIWAHSADLRDPLEAEEKVKCWAGWGVAGLKIDFFESDSQERIAQYSLFARLAAQYRLMLNFHGASKPTGTSRIWPHVLTYEGVMGGEFYQNYSTFLPAGPDAAHNCTLPFTRNVVGPMDYTPVVYSTYNTGTTDTHQTALTVVFTSYVLHIAEKAEIVLAHPCRRFLEHVPVVWDETRLLEGMPASYATMARRSGDHWFIGGICARRPRIAEVTLDFLEEGTYEVTLYSDDLSDELPFDAAIGALPMADEKICALLESKRIRPSLHEHNIHAVRISSFTAHCGEKLAIPMTVNGGFVMELRRNQR